MVWAARSIIWLWLGVLCLAFAPSAFAQSKKRKAGPPPGVNITIPAPPLAFPPVPPRQASPAPSETYGDWRVVATGIGSYVTTTHNKDGYSFGVWCSDRCWAFFNPELNCDPGDRYPALVGTPAGSATVDLLCEKVGGLKLYTMRLSKELYGAMEIGGTLHIGFALANGEIVTYDYSLTGAMKAAQRTYGLSNASRGPTKDQGLSGETL